jgi:hypothetical protein
MKVRSMEAKNPLKQQVNRLDQVAEVFCRPLRTQRRHWLQVSVLAFSLATQAASAGTKRAPVLRLSDLLSDSRASGYLQESPESKKAIDEQIEMFRPLFEDNLKEGEGETLKKNCEVPEWRDAHPLCKVMRFYVKRDRVSRLTKRRLKLIASQEMKQAFKAKDYKYFYTHLPAVRWLYTQLKERAEVDEFVQKTLALADCPPASFLLNLGLQLETDLPDPKIKKSLLALYTKAVACGQDFASVQASYRLGLLRIFDGKCDEAEELLAKIPEVPQAPDYRIRIGYWRYYCATQAKNTELSDKLRAWLLREYPLSLHTLLAYSDRALEKDLPYQRQADPEVQFRSETDPSLAEFTKVAEALLAKDLLKPAALLLETQVSRVQLTEPGFQLYWLILLKRASNNPASFSLLASIFRSHPELIAKDTLGLMYPFEYFSLVDELRAGFDPFLIISLIRQESAFDTTARSSAGARGLMQLQPATAHHIERIATQQLYNPRINIRLGVKYLNNLVHQFSEEKDLSLAAYNAGPTKIKYWRQRYPTDNRLLFLDLLPLRETRDYVTSIARNYYWYRKLYAPASVTDSKLSFVSLWDMYPNPEKKTE